MEKERQVGLVPRAATLATQRDTPAFPGTRQRDLIQHLTTIPILQPIKEAACSPPVITPIALRVEGCPASYWVCPFLEVGSHLPILPSDPSLIVQPRSGQQPNDGPWIDRLWIDQQRSGRLRDDKPWIDRLWSGQPREGHPKNQRAMAARLRTLKRIPGSGIGPP